jgi:hypothetical protein
MKRMLLLLLAVAACSKGPSEDQCKQLLEHLVDLEAKKTGATATAESQKTDLAKQKAQVIAEKSAEFIGTCMDKTAKDRVECALAADKLDCPGDTKKCNSVADCDDTN